MTSGKGKPLPPKPPTREELMRAPWHFQGLRVPIPGLFGWFEPAIAWVPRAQRALIYQTKESAGDKMYGVSISSAYKEAGQPFENYAGYDFTKDLPGLNALVDEILGRRPGNVIRLFCSADGQSVVPEGGYNDPVGLTYGHDIMMQLMPGILKSLGPDRCRFLQIYAGYDGIFYAHSPDQIVQWGAMIRQYAPDSVQGIEYAVPPGGGIPLGNGEADYMAGQGDNRVGGRMDDYDIISSEYDGQGSDTQCLVHNDNVWQMNGRLRRPGDPYNRPPDQPSGDDPNPPAYLHDNSRGFRLGERMEWATYYDVRGQCTVEAIENDRNYQRAQSSDALVA